MLTNHPLSPEKLLGSVIIMNEKYIFPLLTAGISIIATVVGIAFTFFSKQVEERFKADRERKMALSRATADLLLAYRQLVSYSTQIEKAIHSFSEHLTDQQAKHIIFHFRSFIQSTNTSAFEESLRIVASYNPDMAASIRFLLSSFVNTEKTIDLLMKTDPVHTTVAIIQRLYPRMIDYLEVAIHDLCKDYGPKYYDIFVSWLNKEELSKRVKQDVDDMENDPRLSTIERTRENGKVK